MALSERLRIFSYWLQILRWGKELFKRSGSVFERVLMAECRLSILTLEKKDRSRGGLCT